MRLLFGTEERKALEYIIKTSQIAINSTCERRRCGSIIVKDDVIIGSGFNSPPYNLETQRRCSYAKEAYHRKITDKTCCIHAEQRAIMDALRNNPDQISGSSLYFSFVDEFGIVSPAGEPYCTLCSKMALDVGVKEFVLWQKKGVRVYDTEEYNLLSFQFER